MLFQCSSDNWEVPKDGTKEVAWSELKQAVDLDWPENSHAVESKVMDWSKLNKESAEKWDTVFEKESPAQKVVEWSSLRESPDK